jgi:CRISPR/Cas system CSM-associated protein Csm2 small subunit
MGKRAYHDALELRLADLTKQIAVLRGQLRYLDGIDALRCAAEIRRLELKQNALRYRYQALECEKDGLWENIKADIYTLTDELPSAIEHFMQRLDFRHS